MSKILINLQLSEWERWWVCDGEGAENISIEVNESGSVWSLTRRSTRHSLEKRYFRKEYHVENWKYINFLRMEKFVNKSCRRRNRRGKWIKVSWKWRCQRAFRIFKIKWQTSIRRSSQSVKAWSLQQVAGSRLHRDGDASSKKLNSKKTRNY